MPAAAPREPNVLFKKAVVQHGALWAVLVALVFLSLMLAYTPFGPFNLVVGIAIAALQVVLLGVFFMGLREASGLILITAGSGFVILLSMIVLTLNDLFSRV